jgi:hypothetical protein
MSSNYSVSNAVGMSVGVISAIAISPFFGSIGVVTGAGVLTGTAIGFIAEAVDNW